MYDTTSCRVEGKGDTAMVVSVDSNNSSSSNATVTVTITILAPIITFLLPTTVDVATRQ